MQKKLQDRILSLKMRNDELNNRVTQIMQERENLVQEALMNNGRILELELFMNEENNDNKS